MGGEIIEIPTPEVARSFVLDNFVQEGRENLRVGLIQVKREEIQREVERLKIEARESNHFLDCPYDDEWFQERLSTLPTDQVEEAKKYIRITPDHKIEIIPMGKKFSILMMNSNQIDIFDGSDPDKQGEFGIPGMKYFNFQSAEREALFQGKKMLKNKETVRQFIDYFPGRTLTERRRNLINLFGLGRTGHRIKSEYSDFWDGIYRHKSGGLLISGTYEKKGNKKRELAVSTLRWMYNVITVEESYAKNFDEHFMPALVYEDTITVAEESKV